MSLIDLIKEQPMCHIVARMEHGIPDAREDLKTLHARRAIHIASWGRQPGGTWYPIYAFGDGEDVHRPAMNREELKAWRRKR